MWDGPVVGISVTFLNSLIGWLSEYSQQSRGLDPSEEP